VQLCQQNAFHWQNHTRLLSRVLLGFHIFTKIADAALAQLKKVAIHILSYLDDKMNLTHSRDLMCVHMDLRLRHFSCLGLQINWEKSKLSPVQSIFFSGGGQKKARSVDAEHLEDVQG